MLRIGDANVNPTVSRTMEVKRSVGTGLIYLNLAKCFLIESLEFQHVPARQEEAMCLQHLHPRLSRYPQISLVHTGSTEEEEIH